MHTAQKLRKENIAEYILYLWQLEDLLRALSFRPKTIFEQLVAPRTDLDELSQQEMLMWYMDIVNLLREEGKAESGHLEHTMHLIGDMNNLHLQLLQFPIGKHYKSIYSGVESELPSLKERLGRSDMSDVELFFRALYAVVLLRLKNRNQQDDTFIQDVTTLILPVVSELTSMYHKVELGKVDLFEGTDQQASHLAHCDCRDHKH